MKDYERRGCYCDIWEKNPKFYEDKGVPRGFCGMCVVCGKPGHTRQHPGAPVTATWCDHHYRMLVFFHPMSALGCVTWTLIIGGAVWGAWHWIRR